MSEKKILTFAAQNSIDVLQDDEDMLIVSLDLMHEGLNRNRCNIPHEAIVASLDTIPNKPIAFRYNKQNVGEADDVTEHARNEKQLFDTRIGGHIPTDARMKFVRRDNGKVYLNVEGVIQKKYLPTLMNIIRKQKGKLKVSVEFLAEGIQNEETGIFDIIKFKFQCAMLLSDSVLEGIEGSNMLAAEIVDEEVEQMNSRYFSFAYKKESIIEEIKNLKKEEQTKVAKLTMRQLEDKIWSKLKDYTYRDGEWIGKRYWIIDLDVSEKAAYIHDNQTDADYKVPYSVDKNGDVNVDMDGKKEVEQTHEWKEKSVKNSYTFAKDEYGTGSRIEIDKSKEALSDDEWGKVNKTDLRNKVLDAENYKELVKAVYLVVEDGWEDAPSEKLKYPVMQIKGGKAVYNRYALASALGYAKANNETEVIGKVMELYKKLGIGDEKEVENKLDKDNPEIEKIRDDADAIEDEKKNAEIDKPEEKKLEDDVDADKDYWKKKHEETNALLEKANCDYAALEAKFAELTKAHEEVCSKLKVFETAEAKREKKKYLNRYRNAFDSSEYEILAKRIDEDESRDEFCAFVDAQMLEKSKKQYGFECDDGDDEREYRNALEPANGFIRGFATPAKEADEKPRNIDYVLNNLKK